MPLTRNLRDGELTLIDGDDTALAVLLDDGDLSWTETVSTVEVLDRGSIAAGHTRPGDDVPVELSFTAKWTQLVHADGDPHTLYEFLSVADPIRSTSDAGEQRTLTLEFAVADPSGGPTERVRFDRVFRQSLTMSEGDDANRIAFTGRSFASRPTVTRDEV